MSDWWASRLGGGTAAPASSPPAYSPPPQAPGQWQPTATAQAVTAPTMPEKVTPTNLIEAMHHWHGGEGAANSGRCPGCGGTNLFRRKIGATEAAPLCYDCGWNGMWTQVQPRN